MPSLTSIIARFALQDILYWEKTGDDAFGKPLYANPTPLKVRWEDKQQEIILPDARKVMSHGYILTSVNTVVGSIIWQGNAAQYAATPGVGSPNQIPSQNVGGREIIKVNITPGFRQLTGFVNESYI